MNIALTLDIVRRYTRPGQTIIDPFLGNGGTLVALLEGRGVIGIELERHHYESAVKNARHLERLAAQLGKHPHYSLWRGDSREVIPALGPPRAFADSAVTSPAFGEMNSEHAGGNVTQRPNKDGVGFEGGKEFFTYDRNAQVATGSPPFAESLSYHQQGSGGEGWELLRQGYTPEQIKAMRQAGDPRVLQARKAHSYDGNAAAVGSPPYADALNETPEAAAKQRERVTEKIANGAVHSEGTKWGRRGSWGGGMAHRVTQGYEGVLPDVAAGSPPYEDTLSRNRSREPYAKDHPDLSKEYGRTDPSRSADGYGGAKAQIGNMKLKDNSYQDACREIYAALYDAILPGGVLVLVTGDYVRKDKDGVSKVIDLAQITIDLCVEAGWTPLERWTGRKKRVSFWRGYWAKKGQPLLDYEMVLVFCRGEKPAWDFVELPPTGVTDDVEMTPLF
jgi:hypothetical protein